MDQRPVPQPQLLRVTFQGLTNVVVSETHRHEVLGRPEVIHLMAPEARNKADQRRCWPPDLTARQLSKASTLCRLAMDWLSATVPLHEELHDDPLSVPR